MIFSNIQTCKSSPLELHLPVLKFQATLHQVLQLLSTWALKSPCKIILLEFRIMPSVLLSWLIIPTVLVIGSACIKYSNTVSTLGEEQLECYRHSLVLTHLTVLILNCCTMLLGLTIRFSAPEDCVAYFFSYRTSNRKSNFTKSTFHTKLPNNESYNKDIKTKKNCFMHIYRVICHQVAQLQKN